MPDQKDPITFYRTDGGGPYDIHLTVCGRKWNQYAYQFAHEYCHVQSGYELLCDNSNNLLHESICELTAEANISGKLDRPTFLARRSHVILCLLPSSLLTTPCQLRKTELAPGAQPR